MDTGRAREVWTIDEIEIDVAGLFTTHHLMQTAVDIFGELTLLAFSKRGVFHPAEPHGCGTGRLAGDVGGICTMDEQLGTGGILEPLVAAGMVEVPVGVDDIDEAQIILGQGHEDLIDIPTGVDDCRLFGPLAAEYITIDL